MPIVGFKCSSSLTEQSKWKLGAGIVSLGMAENLIQVDNWVLGIWAGSIIFQFLNQTCLCSSTQGFEIPHLAQGCVSHKYRDQCLQLIRDSRKRWGWRGRPLFFASEGICILEVKVKFLKDELDRVTDPNLVLKNFTWTSTARSQCYFKGGHYDFISSCWSCAYPRIKSTVSLSTI